MKIRFITCWEWYSVDKETNEESWVFNHLQYQWSFRLSPKPISELQFSAWSNKLWRKKYGMLINYKAEEFLT